MCMSMLEEEKGHKHERTQTSHTVMKASLSFGIPSEKMQQ